MNCAGTERAGALYVQPDPNSGPRYDLASKANLGFKRFFCWSRRACDRSLSFGLETPRCGSRLLAQWRSRSLGSAAYASAEPAIGQVDALGRHLVLDRELQLLEPRDQHFIGSNLALFALNLGVETGMLAPKRSEEHTSELQSLMRISYAVFCLKKTNMTLAQNEYLLDVRFHYLYTDIDPAHTDGNVLGT